MLFFVDESGIDLHEAPCSVLAAVAFPEAAAWDFARKFSALKRDLLRLKAPDAYDAKGSKLLKRRVFRQAAREPRLLRRNRDKAIESLLRRNEEGVDVSSYELTALAQAKLDFVARAFELARRAGAKTFASIVPRDAAERHDSNSGSSFLRKDWAYLFQRAHCHVCDSGDDSHGILIFDELHPALCRRLLSQMHQYFLETRPGRDRARRILPFPFFVHSHLTPQIQLADLVAYTVNWGLRMPRMTEPVREELIPYADQIFDLRYIGRERRGSRATRGPRIWGIAYIPDLRTQTERGLDLDAPRAHRGIKKGSAPRRRQTLPGQSTR